MTPLPPTAAQLLADLHAPFGRDELCMEPSGCDRIATVFVERPDHWHDVVLCAEHGTPAGREEAARGTR